MYVAREGSDQPAGYGLSFNEIAYCDTSDRTAVVADVKT
jgi:hypothetical protein